MQLLSAPGVLDTEDKMMEVPTGSIPSSPIGLGHESYIVYISYIYIASGLCFRHLIFVITYCWPAMLGFIKSKFLKIFFSKTLQNSEFSICIINYFIIIILWAIKLILCV